MSKPLPRSAPEAQGVNPAAVEGFLDAVEKAALELHGVMVLRHGQVVAEGWWEPYGPEKPHMLFSLSKSFVSVAVGFAVAEGLLTVDDPVLKFFPEQTDALGSRWVDLKVRHLLTMSTGHKQDTTGHMVRSRGGDWSGAFFRQPLVFRPGTHFLYNSGATYILSMLVQRLTGQRVLDYLTPRLLEPLGIEGATWDQSPQGCDIGGWGLNLQLEDTAKFGQFLLQRGQWGGRQLLPAAWVDEATAKQIDNGDGSDSDWGQGYGYLFWRNSAGGYRADGAFGQYSFVFPEQDAVIAMNCGEDRGKQAIMKLVWKLLREMTAGDPVPEGSAESMRRRLGGLRCEPPRGQSPEGEAALDGRVFRLEKNRYGLKTVAFRFDGGACEVAQTAAKRQSTVRFGLGRWLEGVDDVGQGPVSVAAAYGWDADGALLLVRRLVNTPFTLTSRVAVRDGGILLQVRAPAGNDSEKHPAIPGSPMTEK